MKEKIITLLHEIAEIMKSGTLSDEGTKKLTDAKSKLERALETFESIEKVQLGILILEVARLLGDYLLGK